MATVSRARRTAETRSGGKIVKPRRIAAAASPYSRPLPPVPENPNWFTGLINPATRIIATGASKIISSVFGSDSSSSSSTSSDNSGSEDEDDDDDVEKDISSQGAGGLSKEKVGASSEMIRSFRKSELKYLVEQLLMQETFSREESDKLIDIIKSRVVDQPIITETENGRLMEISHKTVSTDMHTPDICSAAVKEAKKWLEEKKKESSSKLGLDYRTCTLNSAMLPNFAEGQAGSPVDMAKSYMRARPLWSSPSPAHIETTTPSPSGVQLFKEDTPYSFGRNSLSSSKLHRSSSGSWNILEELRKVRSKATEVMLATSPTMKTDLYKFSLDPKVSHHSLLDIGDLAVEKSKDESLKSSGGTAFHDFKGNGTFTSCPSTLDMIHHYDSQNAAVSSNPAVSVSQQNQDSGAIQIADGKGESRLSEGNFSTPNDVSGSKGTLPANGFPSTFSLSAGLSTQLKPGQLEEDNPNPVSSCPEKITASTPVEDNCGLSEASIEVPIVNETPSGSQNSSSMHYDELLQEPSRPGSKRGSASMGRSLLEKQQERKRGRYSRKNRARGK